MRRRTVTTLISAVAVAAALGISLGLSLGSSTPREAKTQIGKLDLADYSTAVGVVPVSSEQPTTEQISPDTTLDAPPLGASSPISSQQAAMAAESAGIPGVYSSGVQPKMVYAVVTNTSMAPLPAGMPVPSGVSTVPLSQWHLTYDHVQMWVAEYLNAGPTASGHACVAPDTTSCTAPPAPIGAPVGSTYVFVNSTTGKYAFAE
jgi:hypothetical protein